MIAAAVGDHEIVNVLLDAQANVNFLDPDSLNTPLLCAAHAGHVSMIRRMISIGAKLDVQNKWGETPLMIAALKGHKNVVEILLAAGAAVDTQNVENYTAFIFAVEQRDVVSMRILLDNGADVNAANLFSTSLHVACTRGMVESVAILIEANVNVNVTDSFGRSPFDVVRELDVDEDVKKELIDLLGNETRNGEDRPGEYM